jgi:hypothetical protein
MDYQVAEPQNQFMTVKVFSASNSQLQGNVSMLSINILLVIRLMKNALLYLEENQNEEHLGSVRIMNGMTTSDMTIFLQILIYLLVFAKAPQNQSKNGCRNELRSLNLHQRRLSRANCVSKA